MSYSLQDVQALKATAMGDVGRTLRMPVGEIITVSEACRIAGKSDETIRRWCGKYGIGRKGRIHTWTEWEWQVSRPGLMIVLAKDWDALDLLQRDERDHPDLAKYLSPENVGMCGSTSK